MKQKPKQAYPLIIVMVMMIQILLILNNPLLVYGNRGIGVMPQETNDKMTTGHNWLLIIGIDNYIEWPKLKTAVHDAQAVKDILIERYDFSADHVISILDLQGTRHKILNALKKLASQLTPLDRLVIFYAGHGHIDNITKVGSWIPVDAGLNDVSARITNFEIKSYLRIDAIKAKHILLISDSCFSGEFFRSNQTQPIKNSHETIQKSWQKTSRMAITSGGIEPVVDQGFKDHSVFSHFLLDTLQQNNKHYLPVSELFENIKSGVIVNAKQTPIYGILLDTGAQIGGEMVFCLDPMFHIKSVNKKETQLQHLEQEARQIQAYEQRMIELDQQIASIQEKINHPYTKDKNNLLDQLVKMIDEKEHQHAKMMELKYAYHMQKVDYYQKLLARLQGDVEKYKRVATSPYGKSYIQDAWNGLISKYPDISNIPDGDADALLAYVQGQLYDSFPKQLTNKMGMTFVYISPGTFMMGSPDREPGRDRDEELHEVTLTKPFYMQTTEVTQGQWTNIMGTNPSFFKACGENCPVEQISWNDTQALIQKLNAQDKTIHYRLPTESEWEYASRAGSSEALYSGSIEIIWDRNSPTLDPIAWYGGNSCASYEGGFNCKKWYDTQYPCKTCGIQPVAQKEKNNLGLYDMLGNVWEWCQDWYGDYPTNTITDPIGLAAGTLRVSRGGSWSDFASYCRCANRGGVMPEDYNSSIGCRLVAFPIQ